MKYTKEMAIKEMKGFIKYYEENNGGAPMCMIYALQTLKGEDPDALRFVVRDREAGNIIERFGCINEAEKRIKEFEEQDKADGTYTKNFYEVYDSLLEEIV